MMRRQTLKINRNFILITLMLMISGSARATDLSGQHRSLMAHDQSQEFITRSRRLLAEIEPPDKTKCLRWLGAQAPRGYRTRQIASCPLHRNWVGVIWSAGFAGTRINAQMLRDGGLVLPGGGRRFLKPNASSIPRANRRRKLRNAGYGKRKNHSRPGSTENRKN